MKIGLGTFILALILLGGGLGKCSLNQEQAFQVGDTVTVNERIVNSNDWSVSFEWYRTKTHGNCFLAAGEVTLVEVAKNGLKVTGPSTMPANPVCTGWISKSWAHNHVPAE